MAKSMLDSRIIDLHFNKIFLKLVLGEQVTLTLDNLKVLVIYHEPTPLFTPLCSSSIPILHHPWRNCKAYPKNHTVERLVDFRLRRVSLY